MRDAPTALGGAMEPVSAPQHSAVRYAGLFLLVIQRLPPSCHDRHGWCRLHTGMREWMTERGFGLRPVSPCRGEFLSPAWRSPQCSDYPLMIPSLLRGWELASWPLWRWRLSNSGLSSL